MKSAVLQFEIAGVPVGRDARPYILAEIGINHNGDVKIAEELIHAAKESGADGVKFQTFKAEDLVNRERSPEYYELFKKVELDRHSHEKLLGTASDAGIAFISTPFGEDEAQFLSDLGVPAIKIASGDVTNHLLLEKVAGLNLPVILSTGMSYMEEVVAARDVLVKNGCHEIVLLHCVSRYPTTPGELNLRSIKTMLDEFPDVIGFSDHTEGIWASIAAVSMGARFIEKHFTLDRKMDGPDHALSAEPDELKELVESIGNTYDGLGSGIKEPCPAELENRHLGRKGIYAALNIDPGTELTRDILKVSRPEGDIGADEIRQFFGLKINRKIQAGGEITRSDLS
ncbi:MAG TPA: N-acetylneuraminate synthase family protein [bacterium]|jgi:sialic acid synthase SpsE